MSGDISNIQQSKVLITSARASGDIILKGEKCRLAINVEVRASADDPEYRIIKCQITTTENTPKRDHEPRKFSPAVVVQNGQGNCLSRELGDEASADRRY